MKSFSESRGAGAATEGCDVDSAENGGDVGVKPKPSTLELVRLDKLHEASKNWPFSAEKLGGVRPVRPKPEKPWEGSRVKPEFAELKLCLFQAHTCTCPRGMYLQYSTITKEQEAFDQRKVKYMDAHAFVYPFANL